MTSVSSTSSTLNTSGITVGSDGKVHVSGISSGIDTQALINAQIAASSVPITNLQTKISTNTSITAALNSLKAKVSTMQTAMDKLRNNLSFGSTNVFNQMAGSGTTAAGQAAPANYVPSDINSLLTTSFSAKAQAGSHTITVKQLAQAQQMASDVQNVASGTDLGMTGTLTINGKDVNIIATDSMMDIRDKINGAGVGATATIVSSDSTHNYLILTSATTGTGSNAITLTHTALSDTLGLTYGGGAPKNELQQAKNAIIDVDGITNITRSSNVISDVIDGVTMSLTKAEPDTVINLKVAPDLNGIKTAIGNFVTAYNDLRAFVVDQNTASDRNKDGTVATDEFGPLYNNPLLRGMADQMQYMAVQQVTTNPDGYRSLSQIGVTMNSDYQLTVDDSAMDPKLLGNVDAIKKLFGFSYTSSDSRVNIVSRTSNTASGTYYLSLEGTDASGNITGARMTTAAASGTTADGSIDLLGNNVLSVNANSAANGLVLGLSNLGNNSGSVADIASTVQRGIADNFFDYFANMTKTNGSLDTAVSTITTQNSDYQSQVDTLQSRIDTEKTNLTNKYAAMEAALASLQSLKDTISQYFSASSNSNG